MKKRIQILLHNPKGHTGLIGEKIKNMGHQIQINYPLHGDTLPDIKSYDAAIVFGGKMSVNDCDSSYPEIYKEIEWIKNTVLEDKPYLGICLGGQLLARAFGGKITRHHQDYVEIGYYNIYPTLEGFLDIFSDAPDKFFQWHNEGFTLPENAIKLAASDLYPNQAFRIGNKAYGFQFHPEATLEQIKMWHQRDQEELKSPGAQTVPMQMRDRENYTPKISKWLDNFLNHWLNSK